MAHFQQFILKKVYGSSPEQRILPPSPPQFPLEGESKKLLQHLASKGAVYRQSNQKPGGGPCFLMDLSQGLLRPGCCI